MKPAVIEPVVEEAASGPDRQRILDSATLAHLAVSAVAGVVAIATGGSPLDLIALPVLLAAAAWLVLSSLGEDGQARPAWRLLGSAVALAAAAETIGAVVTLVSGSPSAGPGISDVLALGFYVLAILGILRLPTSEPSHSSGLRSVIDAMVGTVAISVLVWDLILQHRIAQDGIASLARPVLDLLVLAAALLTLLRRSPHRGDRRLVALSVGIVALLLADVRAVAAPGETGLPRFLLLVAAGAVAAASWFVRRPSVPPARAFRPPPVWKLAVPYSGAVLLLVLFSYRALGWSGSSPGVLPLGAVTVGALLLVRQVVANRETREMVEAERDQLLAAVSQGLRAPLTAVAGFSDLLASSWETYPEDERNEMLTILAEESEALVAEVVDLAALARDELDQVDLHITRNDGKAVIADAIVRVFDVSNGPPPVKAQVEPYLEVVADRERLAQMLAHLLTNAHRYGHGKILVVAKRSDDGRVFEVHDDGPGLAPRDERLVWDRFERGVNRLNSAIPGSGLGLAIVRALAAAHGGKAGYRRSERLGGACFWVELPYDSSPDVARSG